MRVHWLPERERGGWGKDGVAWMHLVRVGGGEQNTLPAPSPPRSTAAAAAAERRLQAVVPSLIVRLHSVMQGTLRAVLTTMYPRTHLRAFVNRPHNLQHVTIFGSFAYDRHDNVCRP